MMGYRNWAKANRETIKTTAAIVSAVGLVIAAVGLVVSVSSMRVATEALEQSKIVAKAQLQFELHKLYFDVSEKIRGDTAYLTYITAGPESLTEEELISARIRFADLIQVSRMTFNLYKLGIFHEAEWKTGVGGICSLFQDSVGRDKFWHLFLKDSKELMDREFIGAINDCLRRANVG